MAKTHRGKGFGAQFINWAINRAREKHFGGEFVHAYAHGSAGYSFGISYAKGKCKEARKKASVEAECVIFAKGDRIVLQSY